MAKKKLVILSGAGISAESGLRTFRDSDGLWEGYNVEDVATPEAWQTDPQLVLNFYNERRRNVADAKPNTAHIGLAELENDFDVTVITQNIDDLHERAGSTNVLQLHGGIFKMRSEWDDELISEIKGDLKLGDLATDGKQLRPFIVWFGEPVVMMEKAVEVVYTADIFAVVGTSLAVYPAAGLINYVLETTPKYIIDKKIPYTSPMKNLTLIEKAATEGIVDFKKLLLD